MRIDPVLTLGIVQITPIGHMLAPAIVALLAWAAVERNQATANLLGISSDEGVLVALLAYLLLQVGRVVHEVGHAVTGVYTGRRLLAVRLTPLFMAVEWPSNVLWHAPRASRRLTAAAGSSAQVTFGLALLAAAGAFGLGWPPVVHEAIVLSGELCIWAPWAICCRCRGQMAMCSLGGRGAYERAGPDSRCRNSMRRNWQV